MNGYQRSCPKCDWRVMKPDDLDGRREANRLYGLHVAKHAPDRRLLGQPKEPRNPHQEGENETYDEWYQQNYADSPVSHADYTFGEEVWKAAQTAVTTDERCVKCGGLLVNGSCENWCAPSVPAGDVVCSYCGGIPTPIFSSAYGRFCSQEHLKKWKLSPKGIEAYHRTFQPATEPAPSSGEATKQLVIDSAVKIERCGDDARLYITAAEETLIERISALITTEREATRTAIVGLVRELATEYDDESIIKEQDPTYRGCAERALAGLADLIERTPLDKLRKP